MLSGASASPALSFRFDSLYGRQQSVNQTLRESGFNPIDLIGADGEIQKDLQFCKQRWSMTKWSAHKHRRTEFSVRPFCSLGYKQRQIIVSSSTGEQ